MVVIAGVQALLPVGEGSSVGRDNLAIPAVLCWSPVTDLQAKLVLHSQKRTQHVISHNNSSRCVLAIGAGD